MGELALLDEFFETLRTDYERVCYGLNATKYACEKLAVKNLLISDHLFRSKNVSTRKTYVAIAEDAEKNGIKVNIFSSENPTGKRLKDMTGVCCILKYPLPELEDIDEASDADSSQEGDDEEEKINVELLDQQDSEESKSNAGAWDE